jgi:predicted RNA-binding protein with PIN domain
VADPTLYLFDGYNLLHAGGFGGTRELIDKLASFVAMKGARGVLVFDGAGQDLERGPLSVRYHPHADTLLERLAVEHRRSERVCVVSSDRTVRGTAGREVQTLLSRTFLGDLEVAGQTTERRSEIGDHVDDETRARLERLRRGEDAQ